MEEEGATSLERGETKDVEGDSRTEDGTVMATTILEEGPTIVAEAMTTNSEVAAATAHANTPADLTVISVDMKSAATAEETEIALKVEEAVVRALVRATNLLVKLRRTHVVWTNGLATLEYTK